MRCHWSHDSKGYRFWFPQCYGGIYGPERCHCPRTEPSTERQQEKELKRIIKNQEKEIAALNRTIENIMKRRRKNKQFLNG